MNRLDHIAIIMDGNGRWAQNRSHPRFWGHIRGSSIVSDIVEEADDLGAKALTLYAFSTENWSRPVTEIKVLFELLKKYLLKEKQRIISNNIKFKVIGDISKLPTQTKDLIKDLEDETRLNTGLKLSFAFGYGGRKEILDAVNFYIQQNPGKPIYENDLEDRLLTNGIGDVDLLIRTGGDHRISNFLLWQAAYAEIVFTDTPWPEFTTKEFNKIYTDFLKTERRFGGVDEKVVSIDAAKNIAEKNKNILMQEL